MFKLSPKSRRRERVWKLLKERNPELTREKFNETYDYVDQLLIIHREVVK